MCLHIQELVIRDVSGVLVTSGSLPRSLHAKICDARDSDLDEKDIPEFLSDQQRRSTEVSSNVNEADCESQYHSGFFLQVDTSTHTEPPDTTITSTECRSDTNEASLVDSILAVAMRHLDPHKSDDGKSPQSTTPLSPPKSHYPDPSNNISTSSSFPQVVASTSQKRMSIEEERERRRSNIEESTRAALSVSLPQ